MKMRLVEDDNTSRPVYVLNINGLDLYISCCKTGETIAKMTRPEILFQENGIVITGYVRRPKGLYKLTSFALRK